MLWWWHASNDEEAIKKDKRLLKQQCTQLREERREPRREATETTCFQSLLLNAHKMQVSIIHGWDFFLLWCAGKQFKPLSSVKWWSIIITPFYWPSYSSYDWCSSQNPKCFHLHFHVAKQAEEPQIAYISKVGWQIFIAWWGVTFNQVWWPVPAEYGCWNMLISSVINEPSKGPLCLHYGSV